MDNILFLTLDVFRQTGGVQQVNKLLFQALRNILKETKGRKSGVFLYSLYDQEQQGAPLNQAMHGKFHAFSGNKFRFIYNCIKQLSSINLIILSHIHLLPVALLLFLIKPDLRIILLAHGEEIKPKLPLWKRQFMIKKIEIWAVSAFVAQHLENKLGHRLQVRLLNNALPPDFVQPYNFNKPVKLVEKYSLSSDDKILLTVCRINTQTSDKGVEQILKSLPFLLSVFPKICYFIVGPIEAVEQVRLGKIIDTFQIHEHVIFVDHVSQNLLTDYYLLADVFVMPSKKEGFGLAFIEAAACGCKIIAGNSDGSTDAVLNGKLGTLIDPDDLQQLQEAIISSLNAPRNTVEATATRNLCLKHFSAKAYQKRVSDLLFNSSASKTST